MHSVIPYVKPHFNVMALTLLIKTVAALSELMLPFLLTYILDSVIITMDVGKVVFYGSLMLVFAAVTCVGNITANRIVARTSSRISRNMRRDLFEKIMYLSARSTDKFTVPSLEARITTDTYNVHSFLSQMQKMGVRAPIFFVGGIIITLFLDVYMSLVMIGILPIIFVVVYFVSKKGARLYTDVQNSLDSMVRVVREDSQGIRVIKALSKNDYENERYDGVNRALFSSERRAGIIIKIPRSVLTLLMNLGITAVVLLGAFLVSKNLSSPATLIAFIQYFTILSTATISISQIFLSYTKAAASARRIGEVLNTPDDFTVTENREKDGTGTHVSFENVSFSYLGRRNNLENISFSLRRGERLGIIGATGSGKSTLVKLLLRFYDADAGVIKIDGRDLRSYPREELSAMFGTALQSDFLYAESIEENIRFGRDIPHDDVERAAKIAQAADFIGGFEDGYSHRLTPKGTNLSGGQRQRLMIARAVAGTPEILVLDDSSSALDYKTDANLRRALKAELSGTTVITVAQRVSSVKDCDLILVLDGGRVIGRGTHGELLETCAEYREISDSQMGGAIVE